MLKHTNGDAGRSSPSMAASNGISRRRNSHRTTSLRDAAEEDGEVELQETVRLRDQGSKRERDREFSGRNKRMNSNSSRRLVRSRGEGEESMEEESVGDGDDDDETEEGGGSISRMLPPNATTATTSSTSTFSVISNHNYHHHQGSKSLQPPPRVSRQAIPLKVANERIGVLVPRKARSACVKRSYENWVAGNGGFVEDQNQRRASMSPASRSGEEGSPSSSNVSVRKKMKPSGSKTRFPKVSKSTTSGQEDIEIEIAEVLFGLKRHSQTSKEESLENASQKFQSKEANGFCRDSKISSDATCAQTSILSEIKSSASDPLLASKKLKGEDDSTQVQNSAVVSAVKGESDTTLKLEVLPPKPGSNEVDAVCKASSQSSSLRAENNKQEDLKSKIQESRVADKEKSSSLEKESAACTNIDVDLQDSTVTKVMPNISAKESQRKKKFKFDLMAFPPMATSPEQHDIGNLLSLDSIPGAHDSVKVHNMPTDEEQEQRLITEAVDLEFGEKIKKIAGKNESKLDMQKLSQESCNDNGSKSQPKQQLITTISKVKATAQPSSVPLPIPVAGWPSGLPPLGYVPTVQTIVPTDGTNIASTAVKNMNTQTRLKRCATHHYIASNIRMHQQLLKMNHFWPAAALCGAKPNTLSTIPSAENMIIANPSFPVQNLNISQERGMATANIPVSNTKNRSSEDANCVVRLHQSSQPDPAGNLMHGQAFIFSLNQHQAPVTATTNQRRVSKSTASINNVSLPGNVISGVAANPSALPAAVSFSYPNLANNENPYLTILPNNSYPFPISTAAFRGGNPSQALPFYNGSFYPSQMLHPSQLQQQPPRSHPVVQPVHQNASASSGSSNHKQPQSTLPRVAHSSNNFLASTNMQAQQPQKHLPSHQSQKLENEMRGESKQTAADARKSLSKASVHGQNYIVPLQPNFTLIPSSTACGSVNGCHGEKQQQQQSQAKKIKGGVERIPSQTFAMSFPSFNGSNIVSNLNFSSMAQNPAILQTLPDTTRHAYHVVSAPQTSNKKNLQLSEGKKGGNSTNVDEGKKASLGKSMTSVGQTLAFDSPHRTLNFVSSPFPGNWPTQATSTTSTPIPASSSNSQQQHLLQLQNQHIVHQQQQHPAGVPRSKVIVANGHPSYSVGGKFSSNGPFFSQSHAQSNSASQNMQWKNSPRTSVASNPSAHKNVSQPQGRAPQGQSQISFGANSKSVSVPQGQQMPPVNQASPTRATGSPPSGGNFKTTSMSTKSNASAPAPQPPPVDASSPRNTQKSSPVCGRNVPSILSACPSHLSELKY